MAKVAKSLKLPRALGVYVSLFQPRDPPAGSTNGKPRYSLVLLYPKKDGKEKLQELMQAAIEVAENKWGAGKGKQVVEKMRWPIVADGDERYPDDPTFKGMYFVRASSVADPTRRPPIVVDKNVQRVDSDEDAYSGCTFITSVRLFPFDRAGNRGVGVGLNNVQVVKKGPRLDGRLAPEDEFTEVQEEGETGADLL